MPSATAIPTPEANGAAEFESQHVHAVYDAIAPHFAATRYSPWPAVKKFLDTLEEGCLVADVGCGNGKYMEYGKKAGLFMIGTDRCEQLVHYATKDKIEGGVADARRLPFRDSIFDAAVNVAVVHHFATRERRVEAWKESLRVVRKGGRLLGYVWAIEKPNGDGEGRRFEGQDLFVEWNMRRKKEGAVSEKILGDPMEKYDRFYHVYRDGELEDEMEEAGGKVIKTFYDHQNWGAVVEKQ